jgi:hypothetical protein
MQPGQCLLTCGLIIHLAVLEGSVRRSWRSDFTCNNCRMDGDRWLAGDGGDTVSTFSVGGDRSLDLDSVDSERGERESDGASRL